MRDSQVGTSPNPPLADDVRLLTDYGLAIRDGLGPSQYLVADRTSPGCLSPKKLAIMVGHGHVGIIAPQLGDVASLAAAPSAKSRCDEIHGFREHSSGVAAETARHRIYGTMRITEKRRLCARTRLGGRLPRRNVRTAAISGRRTSPACDAPDLNRAGLIAEATTRINTGLRSPSIA
jgi:hypothetical protein